MSSDIAGYLVTADARLQGLVLQSGQFAGGARAHGDGAGKALLRAERTADAKRGIDVGAAEGDAGAVSGSGDILCKPVNAFFPIALGVIAAVALMNMSRPSEFLYFNF